MSVQSQAAPRTRAKPRLRLFIVSAATLALIAAMALDTKVVKIGSAADIAPNTFSPAAFGAAEFPKVKSAIEGRAVDAVTLAAAVAKDKDAAIKEYGLEPSKSGVAASAGTVICVKFTGVVGKGESGEYAVNVEGVPSTLVIRVQTGPAIYGTDLRDATGMISFQQFDNQIDYQKVGSALNNETKKQILSKIETAALAGKTVSVVGAFKLSNPRNWLVTPVKLDVQ
jgi:predicted lipoprotein